MTDAPPIRRVLVANRGEIACRIIRTLRRLGIASIAVFSEADAGARHVREADIGACIGAAAPAESYLRADRVVAAAVEHGADAIHPGYGFLSEDAGFAAQVETAGIRFCGPTPDQIARFGRKDAARALAWECGLPLLPGGAAVADVDAALAAADAIGYPVMLKSAGGGGGIGMSACAGADELAESFATVAHVARASFGSADLYVERFVAEARHLEVQVFGDGAGRVLTLGERDCSVQRRNQKVLEETPAPRLHEALRERLVEGAIALCGRVAYRSAGTVEFLVDVATGEPYFLEVNTRLQVEHGVTEATHGIDLVEWMVRLAAGEPVLDLPRGEAAGHAIEARVYAEDPARDHRPSAGRVTHVAFPDTTRVDTWLEAGTEVTPHYDPLLAKVIVHEADRDAAVEALRDALDATRIDGIETNLALLRAVVDHADFADGAPSTALLASVRPHTAQVEVVEPGLASTVQDLPGRLGFWAVGVPPSGPMDPLSFSLANRALGNAEDAPAIEMTRLGCTLRFGCATRICLGGAVMDADLDGAPVAWWEPEPVMAGQTLRLGAVSGAGVRTYLAVDGGIDVPPYLGSRSTFALGGFGGHGGRSLRVGDVLRLARPGSAPAAVGGRLARHVLPDIGSSWELEVRYGPHAAPDFFTREYLDELLAATWRVHHNSDRTGVRLVGPRPGWARPDGGDAGLHPSNIHDTPYAVGAVDFTGDMPVILGPDGPSLGGFVCPATVAGHALWKLGQLSPGDEVRFALVGRAGVGRRPAVGLPSSERDAVLARLPASADRPEVVYRRSGDANILVEYGEPTLDIALRMRVHALMRHVEESPPPALIDVTPGIRSLQVHFDPRQIDSDRMLGLLVAAEAALPDALGMVVESRTIRLPLSWEDPNALAAVQRYMHSVRPDAPWCPSNVEFIRRINGLDHVDDVREIVFGACYLVLGLGDVYLGAPVATPLDPRHRLVTTKYNPARTWTPENAVGIGGAYMCVYGMEGPGGYQLVGRTVPVWNTYRVTASFAAGSPWLLRFFDRIRFFPVTADELTSWRRGVLDGTRTLEVEDGTLSMRDHRAFLEGIAADAAAFRVRQQAAFAEERDRWAAAPEFVAPDLDVADAEIDGAETAGRSVRAHLAANVWKLLVAPGARVSQGDVVAVLEAMKMEVEVKSDLDGVVTALRCQPGDVVVPGQPLIVVDDTARAVG